MMKALKGAVNQAKGFFDNYKAPFLLLFLLVACATTYGQVDTTKVLQRINALGYQYKNIDVDSSFVIPQDTFKLRYADSSGIAIKKGVMYRWTGTKWVAIARKLTDSTVIFNGDTLKISGTGSSGAGSLTNLTATDKTGISWNITNPTTTPNLDLSISVNRMIRDSAVLATPVSNFYSLPVNSTIVVFRALTGNTGVDITTTGGVNSGTTARAGKPFIIANQDSVYKLVLSPYSISDSGTVNDVAPRSWVMIVPIATQWYKVASGSFSQVGSSGGGAATEKLSTITTNTTASITSNIYLANTTSGAVTLTVNPATFYSSGTVTKLYVKKITNNANTVTITPSSGLINGASSYTIYLYNESVTLVSDGTNLYTL